MNLSKMWSRDGTPPNLSLNGSEQRRVVTDVMLDTNVTRKGDTQMLLKDHEWHSLLEISSVLKHMSSVTTYMCLERDV
jgi:hypothetical protein